MLHGKRIFLDDKPYLTRYYLKGDGSRETWEIWLHNIHTADPWRDPHNHPFDWFLSIVLWGWYAEERYDWANDAWGPSERVKWYSYMPHRSIFHRITWVKPGGVWTLIIVPAKGTEGARRWTWGYASQGTDRAFVPHNEAPIPGARTEEF